VVALFSFNTFNSRRTLLVASIATISIVIFLFIASNEVHKLAEIKISKLVDKVQSKAGIPLSIGHWRIGFGKAYFEDIVVGEAGMAVISEISANFAMNPFKENFGTLSSLTIHRLRVKSQEKDLPIKAPRIDSQKATEIVSKDLIEKFFKAIPVRNSLLIKSGEITVVSEDGRRLLDTKGFMVKIEKSKKKMIFKIPSLRINETIIEKNLSGRFYYSPKKSAYVFNGQQVVNEDQKSSFQGIYSPGSQTVTVEFDAKKIPTAISYFAERKNIRFGSGGFKGAITIRKEFSDWKFFAQVNGRNLSVKSDIISPKTIGPIAFNAKIQGFADINNKKIGITNSDISLLKRHGKKLYVKAKPQINLIASIKDDQSIEVSARFDLKATDCQSILELAPHNLVPVIKKFRLSGQYETSFTLALNTSNLDQFYYDIHNQMFGCKVINTPSNLTASYLNGPFSVTREVSKEEEPLKIDFSEANKRFSKYDNISPYLNKAFVTSEDAGFWSHKGIDSFAIENALRRNLSEQRVAIGGSTITMQTVKNLFLNHRRTLSRKIQEMFLAWHLEHVTDKKRIMELYMNVAEFGPNIYGVTQAADHYFNKLPYDLNLRESAFLAQILPSPVKRYDNFCSGFPSDDFNQKIDSLLARMLRLGKIDAFTFDYATNTALEFDYSHRLDSEYCHPDAATAAPEQSRGDF